MSVRDGAERDACACVYLCICVCVRRVYIFVCLFALDTNMLLVLGAHGARKSSQQWVKSLESVMKRVEAEPDADNDTKQ